jgi:UDP-N-acetylmuramoyl-L-alanyl-D-glutamate--2,6-diaminopimelate ligase
VQLERQLDELGEFELIAAPAGPTVRGGDVDIVSVTHDSRQVVPGTLFCCVPGERFDGHDFAAAAAADGAVALLVDRPLPLAVTQIVVPAVRPAMAQLAAAWAGHPSRSLVVAGVTGTNGKTTVTHLLAAVFEAHGWPTDVIGTISGARTTPEATELQGRLAAARDAGKRAVAMEVSSHALVQHRVDGTRFAAATFTNLSQDHLDFHGTMDAYFSAKARLFEPDLSALAVVNTDDPWGMRLATMVRIPVHPFGMADASDLELDGRGSRFGWRGQQVTLPLAGRLNVSNALAAATTAAALGIPAPTIASGLSNAPGVPGRFEQVDAGQPFSVIVDYAHTPDGLEQVLGAARQLVDRDRHRLVVVFGCGGDRDRAKRPLMGEIATRLADRAILTSDNPRSEDPMEIIREVLAGAGHVDRLVVEPDRAEAIRLAVTQAEAGDIVVIAGKGHETGQEAGGVVTPFDDRQVARALLEQR